MSIRIDDEARGDDEDRWRLAIALALIGGLLIVLALHGTGGGVGEILRRSLLAPFFVLLVHRYFLYLWVGMGMVPWWAGAHMRSRALRRAGMSIWVLGWWGMVVMCQLVPYKSFFRMPYM